MNVRSYTKRLQKFEADVEVEIIAQLKREVDMNWPLEVMALFEDGLNPQQAMRRILARWVEVNTRISEKITRLGDLK